MSESPQASVPPLDSSESVPAAAGPTARRPQGVVLVVLCLLVATAVTVVHWPAMSSQLIAFDDYEYWVQNRLVQTPSWSTVGQFFREVLTPSTVQGYYQPLTMVSLMTDWALGGRPDNRWAFHRTNLALHVMDSVLVTVFLYLLFRNAWVAALVGLLFGVHPLTVEAVPWIGERKTTLAAFFGLWSLIAYVLYTRKSSWLLYGGALVAFVLSLLAKPTTIAMPLLLLILDYWPLRRINARAIREKIPFVLVAGISAVITYKSQATTAAAYWPKDFPPHWVPLKLCHDVVFYPYKMIWPSDLTPHYPIPEPFDLSQPILLAGVIGTVVLVAVLLLSLRWTRALVASWLFLFLALLPVSGIIGFSQECGGVRFAYFPAVGVLMLLAFALARLWEHRRALGRAGIALVVLLAASAEVRASERFLGLWQTTEELYRYVLTRAPHSGSLLTHLGVDLMAQGRLDEALELYREAVAADPSYPNAQYNLGVALARQGKFEEAAQRFALTIRLRPTYSIAYSNLARALARQGKTDEAHRVLEAGLKVDPYQADAYFGLGVLLGEQGQLDEAAARFRDAIRVNAGFVNAYVALGRTLMAQGKFDEALRTFTDAQRVAPKNPQVEAGLNAVKTALERRAPASQP